MSKANWFVLLGISLTALITPAPSGAQQSFETMTQPAEQSPDCKVPKPPRDLAETAYIRNGYRAILRIMAAKKWRETGSCECFLETITWEDVVAKSEDFVSSESQRRPFDVVLLDQHATDMEAERLSACAAE